MRTSSLFPTRHIARLGEGALLGFVAGMVTVLYRYLLEQASSVSEQALTLAQERVLLALAWLAFLGFLGWVVGYLVRLEPLAAGSGIPHVKGVLSGKLQAVWWRILLVKFAGGILGAFGGLSLGREGPSVQIGAMIGKGWGEIRRKPKDIPFWVTAGGAAGIAASFGAPLAGVLFALEELHRGFSSVVVLASLTASVVAYAVSERLFGLGPILPFGHIRPLGPEAYPVLLLFGILLGVLGALFNRGLLVVSDRVSSWRWLRLPFRPAPVFVASGILGLFLPQVLGGGHRLIAALGCETFPVQVLLILCGVKFLFTLWSYASSTPGGIFFPLLTVGALLGNIFGVLWGEMVGTSSIPIDNLIVLGMAGYFSAITKAPITGSVLIAEITGSFSALPAIVFVCLVALGTSNLLRTRPIYDTLLKRLLHTTTNHIPRQPRGPGR